MKNLKFLVVLLASLFLPTLVYAASENPVAEIVGGDKYDTIQAAVENIGDNTSTTIRVLEDITNEPGVKIPSGRNITIDLNGKTVTFNDDLVGSTGTVSQNMQLLQDSTIVIKNGTLIASEKSRILIQNYSNLTLEDVTLDGTKMSKKDNYVVSINNGTVNILGNTNIKSNSYAMDVFYKVGYPNGTQTTLNTTGTISGDISVTKSDKLELPSPSTLDIKNVDLDGKLEVESGLENNLKIYSGIFNEDVLKYHAVGTIMTSYNGRYTIGYNITLKYNISEGFVNAVGVARIGDAVHVNVTPRVGYKLKSINVTSNGEVIATTPDFTMPESSVEVTVEFEAVETKVENNTVDTTKEVDEITVGINDTKAQDVLLESLKKSGIDISNKNATVKLDIENMEKPAEEISSVIVKDITKAHKNAKIAGYFDITLEVVDEDSNSKLGELSNLTKAIKLSVVLPKDLKEVAKGYKRTYYIVRLHDGKVDILDAILSKDGNSLTFESDKYSVYALAYEDAKITETSAAVPENPKTFDGIATYTVIGAISVIAIAGLYFYFKKELENK